MWKKRGKKNKPIKQPQNETGIKTSGEKSDLVGVATREHQTRSKQLQKYTGRNQQYRKYQNIIQHVRKKLSHP